MPGSTLLIGVLAATVAVQPGQLRILDAVYGNPERGRMCDATLPVAQQCDERNTCLLLAGNGICGDPDYRVAKRLFITFKCGPAPAQMLVMPEGASLRLACDGAGKPSS